MENDIPDAARVSVELANDAGNYGEMIDINGFYEKTGKIKFKTVHYECSDLSFKGVAIHTAIHDDL